VEWIYLDAKEYGLKNDIGIFNTSEFFGAIHYENPLEYSKKDNDGNPIYATKSI